MKIDLNCDLGENEPFEQTEWLAPLITSANIACGGHAGSADSMRACVRLALQYGIKIGAHPGIAQGEGFGRQPAEITASELSTLVLQQVSALQTMAATLGAKVHHVKLHGALYHLVENHESLRRTYLDLMQECWPTTVLYARAGGACATEAQKRGLFVWPEVFLDRHYLPSGDLVPRDQPNALLTSKEELKARLNLLRQNAVKAVDESLVKVHPQTLSLHADSPHAVEFAAVARHFAW